MAKKQIVFEIGSTVFLKSDVLGEHPMTILDIEEYGHETGDMIQVCWYSKSGKMHYDAFPEPALRHGNGLQ